MSTLRGLLVAALMAVGLVPVASAPATAAPGTATFVTAVSDGADEVGRGYDRVWWGNDHVTVSHAQDGAIVVEAHSGDDPNNTYNLEAVFIPPSGQSLTAGEYDVNESEDRTRAHPSMHVEANLDVASADAVKYCDDDITGSSFTVHDLTPDLSRLWISYEQHCSGVPDAIFGEIRYQEPNQGDVVVAPGSVVWPVSYRDVPARIVPVTLFNTGADAVNVGGAAITEDGSEFSITRNGCRTIPAGGSCSLDVQLVPRAGASQSGRLTIPDSTSGDPQQVMLAGRGIQPGYTSWRMHSQEGDYIGEGFDHEASPADTSIWAQGDQRHIELKIEPKKGVLGDWDWHATFEPPRGQLLTPGTTYTGATRAASHDPSVPGLEIYGQGRGCEPVGWFHVRDLTVEQGRVTSFAATFSQHCSDADVVPYTSTSVLNGSIVWHATRPVDAIPPWRRYLPTLVLRSSPHQVRDGDLVSISGDMYRGEWFELLHHELLTLWTRPEGGGRWRPITSTYTTPPDPGDVATGGDYTLHFRPSVNSDYQVRFAGDADHTPVSSRVMTVSSHWRVHLSRPYPVGHRKVRLYVTVLHGHKGQVVVLEHSSSRGFVREAVRRLSSRGTTSFTVRLPKRGSVVDRRVFVRAGNGRSAALSETQNVPHLGA